MSSIDDKLNEVLNIADEVLQKQGRNPLRDNKRVIKPVRLKMWMLILILRLVEMNSTRC